MTLVDILGALLTDLFSIFPCVLKCTFWLIEALARAGEGDPAHLREAQLKFEEMLTYANHLGLYSGTKRATPSPLDQNNSHVSLALQSKRVIQASH